MNLPVSVLFDTFYHVEIYLLDLKNVQNILLVHINAFFPKDGRQICYTLVSALLIITNKMTLILIMHSLKRQR